MSDTSCAKRARRQRDRISVVITGGGTAGHVEPALAIARALADVGVASGEVLFVGARRGMEAVLVPEAGFALRLLPGRGLVRRIAFVNVSSLLGLLAAFVWAFGILARHRPAVVVMVGGYAGVACSLAAVLIRVPVVVVNVDAVAGRANRLIGRFAAVNAVAGESSGLPRAVVTGAPVREAVLAADRSPEGRLRAAERLGLPPGARVVAIVGGSLGAATLNSVALHLRRRLHDRADLVIYHVTGARNEAAVRAAVDAQSLGPGGVDYRLVPYEHHLPDLYCAADLVIARAGAMTVSELAVIGVASILVPLPGAPGDHQRVNARSLEERGAAVIVEDDGETDERVADLAVGLLSEAEHLDSMARAARSLARPDAATEIAGLVAASMRHLPRRGHRRTSSNER